MWPFSSIKRKDPRQNHEFTQEDTEAGGEATKSKAELRRLRNELEASRLRANHELEMIRIKADIEDAKQQLSDLMDDGEEQEPGSVEDSIMTMLLTKFLGGQASAPVPLSQNQIQQVQTATPDGEPTDQDLRELWNRLPVNVKNQALTQMRK